MLLTFDGDFQDNFCCCCYLNIHKHNNGSQQRLKTKALAIFCWQQLAISSSLPRYYSRYIFTTFSDSELGMWMHYSSAFSKSTILNYWYCFEWAYTTISWRYYRDASYVGSYFIEMMAIEYKIRWRLIKTPRLYSKTFRIQRNPLSLLTTKIVFHCLYKFF